LPGDNNQASLALYYIGYTVNTWGKLPGLINSVPLAATASRSGQSVQLLWALQSEKLRQPRLVLSQCKPRLNEIPPQRLISINIKIIGQKIPS